MTTPNSLAVVRQNAGGRWRGLSFMVADLNMSNEVFGFYNGSKQYMSQREFYKPTYEFGFRWDSAVGK